MRVVGCVRGFRVRGPLRRRRRWDRRRRDRGSGQSKGPAGLDVGGVRESLTVGHRGVQVQVEDLVGDVQRALLVVMREIGRDREHRVAALHDVRGVGVGGWCVGTGGFGNPARARGHRGERVAVIDHERGASGGRWRAGRSGMGEARPHRGRHRHHDQQADGDEPGDALRPPEAAHRRHRHPTVAHLVHDLDHRVDNDHCDGDPHDAQAHSQDEIDDGVVAQGTAKRVADRSRTPRRGIDPAERTGRPEPRARHPDEQERHPDRHADERKERRDEPADGSVIASVHGRLLSARLHT